MKRISSFLIIALFIFAGCGGLYKLRHTTTMTRTMKLAPSAVAVYYEFSDINVANRNAMGNDLLNGTRIKKQ